MPRCCCGRSERAPEGARWRKLVEAAGDRFNRGFERFGASYARLTARLVRMPKRVMAAYAGLIALTLASLAITPTGFIPAQDQGYFFTIIQLPPGSSTARTDAVMKKVAERMLPIPGIDNTVMLSGFDGASETRNASSAAAYWVLDDFDDRAAQGQTIDSLMEEARKATADISEAG